MEERICETDGFKLTVTNKVRWIMTHGDRESVDVMGSVTVRVITISWSVDGGEGGGRWRRVAN